MKKDINSQVWDQIKKHTLIHHVVDWFGVGEVEAFEMLNENDLYSWFDCMSEAKDFLGFVMDSKTKPRIVLDDSLKDNEWYIEKVIG